MDTTLINTQLLGMFRILLWAFLAIFIIFSGIVVRQVQLMRRVLTVPVAGGIFFIALGLFVFAIGVFVLAVALL